MLSQNKIFLATNITYPEFPYLPSETYPEIENIGINPSNSMNNMYSEIRKIFFKAKLDISNFGKPNWNPMEFLIKPNDTILLKPNYVRHRNHPSLDINAMTTHSSLIRIIIDYCLIALKGKGKIIIGDAPLQSANLDILLKENGMYNLIKYYKTFTGVEIDVLDLREFIANQNNGIISGWTRREIKHVPIDLSFKSEHSGMSKYEDYRVTHYNPDEMNRHHNNKNHEYLIAKSVLEADVVINIPKLKTHRKAGVTSCLKNQIGINASKNWLPHHKVGSKFGGGDEFYYKDSLKEIRSYLRDKREKADTFYKKKFYNIPYLFIKKIINRNPFKKDNYDEGSWFGNDTLWRTIIDINKIFFYADRDGVLNNYPVRKTCYFLDAIIIGEKEGPVNPTPKNAGFLAFGLNPVAIDYSAAYLIGLNPKKIPSIYNCFAIKHLKLVDFTEEDISILSNDIEIFPSLLDKQFLLTKAKPASGWEGEIEL